MADRFLRMPEVKEVTGLSCATIYREIDRGQFPRQHRLTRRCVGWWKSEIDAWRAARPTG